MVLIFIFIIFKCVHAHKCERCPLVKDTAANVVLFMNIHGIYFLLCCLLFKQNQVAMVIQVLANDSLVYQSHPDVKSIIISFLFSLLV